MVVLVAIARRPWAPSLAMLLWGSGVAAPLALVVNDLLVAGAGRELTAVLAAPLAEETIKALALLALLLLLPGEVRDARDGILCGALVGVGFAPVENASYLTLAAIQGGPGGLLSGLYLRGVVEGLNHAVFTAAVGAGLGWARSGRARLAAPALGFGAAVGQHVLWNAVASRAITVSLCGAETPGGACASAPAPEALFVTAPLIAMAALGPGGLALLAVARRPPA
jgi:RsiW-degrading membrane proteinase PrsW (M82 family)